MPTFHLRIAYICLQLSLLTVGAYAGAVNSDGFYVEDRILMSPHINSLEASSFGSRVSVDNGRVLIGSTRESNSGKAYLFDCGTGELLQTFESPTFHHGEEFGRAVELEGSYALVGSWKGTYVYDSTTFELLHVLPQSKTIDIDGDRAIIEVGTHGLIYDLQTGTQLADVGGPPLSDVALSGKYAILGISTGETGYVWVYDWTTSTTAFRNLTPANMPVGARFGNSFDIDENLLIVGAPGNSNGTAHLFNIETGELLQVWEGPPSQFGSDFGKSVSIKDGTVVIGSGDHSDRHPGAAYMYSTTTGDEIAKFTTSLNSSTFQGYGTRVDYDGRFLVSGYSNVVYVTNVIPEPSTGALLTALITFAFCGKISPGRATIRQA